MDEDGLELLTLLPPSHACWDRRAASDLAQSGSNTCCSSPVAQGFRSTLGAQIPGPSAVFHLCGYSPQPIPSADSAPCSRKPYPTALLSRAKPGTYPLSGSFVPMIPLSYLIPVFFNCPVLNTYHPLESLHDKRVCVCGVLVTWLSR